VSDRSVSAADLASVAKGVRDWRDDARGEFVPQAALEFLERWIPAMALSYSDVHIVTGRTVGCQAPNGGTGPNPAWDTDELRRERYRTERCRRYLYSEDARGRSGVVRTFDLYTESEWQRSSVYVDQYRPAGEWNQMTCPLAGPPGRARFISFARSRNEGAFTDHDRDLMTILQPHLNVACEERQRNAPPDLTPAQWQVLRYLDAGMTTNEIAEAMFVSPATVRKHVENAFGRMGVTTRVAALARAFGRRTAF
jgi:DNA-binding CsgD family transcriptional regulator